MLRAEVEAADAALATAATRVEFTKRGYLIISAETAHAYFPTDAIIALARGRELWVLPVNNRAAGGLLLKQRNTRGDRSVLVWHVMPGEESFDGTRAARWDPDNAALRIALDAAPFDAPSHDLMPFGETPLDVRRSGVPEASPRAESTS